MSKKRRRNRKNSRIIRGSLLANITDPSVFPFACIQRRSRDEEVAVAQAPNPNSSVDQEPIDVCLLPLLESVRSLDDLAPVPHRPILQERCDRQAGTIYSPSR